MRPILLVGILVATVLAGCTDSDSGPAPVTATECLQQGLVLNVTAGACEEPPFSVQDFEDPRHHCVVTQQADRVHAPDLVGNPWILGQTWDYELSIDGESLGTTKLVYYDDQDPDGTGRPVHYMVGTPTRDEALRHAIFSENPMIGRVHRVLYSPHESGDHADMFHFPLCDGSSWTTVFYGETFSLTARNATVDTPAGPDQGFLIEGSSAGGSTLALSYSPNVQWFTFIDLDRADGSAVDLQLAATGAGYNGEAFFLRGQNDETVRLSTTNPAPQAGGAITETGTISRQDGGDGPYDTVGLHVKFALIGAGVATFTVTDPSGAEAWSETLENLDGAPVRDEVLEVPYLAGDWTLSLSAAAVATDVGLAFAEATMVSIYDRSGSI